MSVSEVDIRRVGIRPRLRHAVVRERRDVVAAAPELADEIPVDDPEARQRVEIAVKEELHLNP